MKKILLCLGLAAIMSACAQTPAPNTNTNANTKPAAAANTAPSQPAKEAAPVGNDLRDKLLAQITEFHQKLSAADPSGLATLATPDYKIKSPTGAALTKDDIIKSFNKEKVPDTLTCTEPVLSNASDTSAVLNYTITITLKTGESASVKMKSTFVKVPDKGWLVKESEQIG